MGVHISVVVPIYNVGPYVESCLASIARQSLRDFEVIVVDDGSTDHGPQVAESFAARDSRFTVLRQANAGLGAARNAGTARARGAFLSFVDGDDVLPEDALAILNTSLERSGSDFATGVVRRFGRGRRNMSNLTPFRRTVLATHISRMPDELLVDRIVTNKLWRRDFWDQHGLRFPEGVLYEDITVGLCAHVLARTVDVLHDTVYWWRHRRSGPASITQQRAVIRGIGDRLEATREVAAALDAGGLPELRRQYEQRVLADDLLLFVNGADRGDGEYRRALAKQVQEYLSECDPAGLELLPALDRLKYHLLSRGLVNEVLEVLAFERSRLPRSKVVWAGAQPFGEYPFFRDRSKGVPDAVYRLDAELQVRARVSDIRWDEKRLVVSGHAHIDWLAMPTTRSGEIRLIVRRDMSEEEFVVKPERRYDGEATRRAGHHFVNYDGSGFVAEFNPAGFLRVPLEPTRLRILAEVEIAGVARRTEIWGGTVGRNVRAVSRKFRRGLSLRAGLFDGDFVVHAEPSLAVVSAVRCVDGQLIIRGVVRAHIERPVIVARRRGGGAVVRQRLRVRDGGNQHWRQFRAAIAVDRFIVPPGDAPSEAEEALPDFEADLAVDGVTTGWSVRVTGPNQEATPIVASDVLDVSARIGSDELRVFTDFEGHLSITDGQPSPTVRRFAWASGTLRLSGPNLNESVVGVALVRSVPVAAHRVAPIPGDDPAQVVVPIANLTTVAGPRPLGDGRWDVRVTPAGAATDLPVRVNAVARQALPSTATWENRRYTAREGAGETMVVQAEPGAWDNPWELQQQRRRALRTARIRRKRDIVVFVSWGGRRAGGDVRAIFEALPERGGPPATWVGRSGQLRLPNATVVESDTREHWELMTQARWIVTDHLLPEWWQPRRGQRVLQTWHGTPVKCNGFALPPDVAAASPLWLRELGRQSAAWDLVLSASPPATKVLQQSLRFQGDAVEAGAPRCDALSSTRGKSRGATARAALGIPDDRFVALWAPTARDEGWSGRRARRFGIPLRLPAAGAAANREWTFVVHGHPALTETIDLPDSQWINATGYPDVHDLLAMADVLITDYSSLLIDFLHTGRPVVIYAPDAEEYRHGRHGLALDVLDRPPGPVVTTGDELWAALDRLANTDRPASYAEWLDAYGGPQDGRSAARALEHLFDR